MTFVKVFIQVWLMYLASIGLYTFWEHHKKTGKEKLIESKPFMVCLIIIVVMFYITVWKR